MLREVKKLHSARIHAEDGDIGKVDEILFDDEHWTVRYLIVDASSWISERRVLISPLAFGTLNWENHSFYLNLTREQIKNSPDVDTDKPVSRQWERSYYEYYNWPFYWGGIGGWGAYRYPTMLLAPPVLITPTPLMESDYQRIMDLRGPMDDHLRSTKEVTGYGITTTDGHLGHIQDFLVDDASWRISYLLIDTRDWWPGKKVLLPVDEIQSVNWSDGTVRVDVTRERIQNAPEWDHTQPMTPGFEAELHDYYSQPHLGVDAPPSIHFAQPEKVASTV